MDINSIILITISVISVLIVVLLLLQQRDSGGIGTLFGGSGGESYRTRRGAEKFLFYLTIGLVVIWVSLLITNLVLS